jgi:DMSO/TMAO reductase YedYZ molybdopterin-dependent catalytic subunit
MWTALPPRSDDLWRRFEHHRRGPLREDAFTSPIHDERVAARLGLALGVCFAVCFATGLLSHLIQRGPDWAQQGWPSRPVGLYRWTQGVHVLTGMATIPLLLAKLWAVYPKLWEWPPVRGALHLIERGALLALVGGAIFQVVTGLLNVFYWYAFPFNFPSAHYAGAWIAIGGLVIHIGAKWEVARRGLRGSMREPAVTSGLTRAGFLGVAFGASAIVVATTAGSAVSSLSRLAVLAPRRNGVGPQGVPVNHGASGEVIAAANSAGWKLSIEGNVPRPFTISLAGLRALPQAAAQLPISCVEGWSTDAHWRGVRLRDLLDRAGADPGATVQAESLQSKGAYRTSRINPDHARDTLTLIALELNGEVLHIEHGYPARLIAPNRPGVEQTKWLQRLVVL